MQAGLEKDAFYLIRPDGHVGFVSLKQDVVALRDYIASHQLVFA